MAKRSEKEVRDEEIDDLRWMLSGPKGRRLMWRILARTGMGESIFRQPSIAVRPEERLIFNGAWKDFGEWLKCEAAAADPVNYEKMDLEARLTKALERGPQQPAGKKREDGE